MPKNVEPTASSLFPRKGPDRPAYRVYLLKNFLVNAGPFRAAFDAGAINVCLQAEKPDHDKVDIRLPIPDFDVPQSIKETSKVLTQIIWFGLVKGLPVYVGCKGGIGRTGIMLALLTRIVWNCPGDEAIEHVRRNYNARAVETIKQEEWVKKFPVRTLRWYYLGMSFLKNFV